MASTLYHLATQPLAKARLKVFDPCAIYLLIAGTYTPFTLVGLRSGPGWPLFVAIWTLALAGIVFKLRLLIKASTGRFKLLSTSLYVAMGWLALVAIKPLLAMLDHWSSAGCLPEVWLTRSVQCSTTGRRCVIRMRSGICSWSPAASAITSRCGRRCCRRRLAESTTTGFTAALPGSADGV